MRKRIAILILIAALLLSAPVGCAAHAEEASPLPQAAQTEAPAAVEAVYIEANTEPEQAEPTLFFASDRAHPALMTLREDGAFRPEHPVTKAELCAILYPMFKNLRGGGTPYSDVARGSDGYTAITALFRAGVLPEKRWEAFYPERSVTRGYLAEVLYAIAEALGGEDGQRVRLTAIDMEAGLTAPEGTLLYDSALVTRAETALIAERMLGREPVENDLFMNGCVPGDVTTEHYAWAYIADAVTEGPVEPVAEGVYRLYGWLYGAWDDGTMIADMDYGVWTFGPDGRYTTGSEALDGYLAEALEQSGANDCADDTEALKAAYLYIKYNFEYIVRPEDMETIPVGVTGWEYDRAERFFRYGGGTCYGYAAAFGLLARALGCHAYAVAAEVNQFYGAHGFVVIPEGDTDIIYDVEMEATRPERHRDFDLFAIENYVIYNYWYVANWRVG